jgi:hypothetical protein
MNKQLKIFCFIIRRVVVIYYRPFGTTYRSRPQGSRIVEPVILEPIIRDPPTLNMGPIGCPETSVRNYDYLLRNNPAERSSQLLRGGSLKSSNFNIFSVSAYTLHARRTSIMTFQIR